MTGPKRPKVLKPRHRNAPGRKLNGRKKIDELYGPTWREYRKQFLKHNLRCYACGNKSEALDHIEPHKGDINIFWKQANYIALCNSCHNTVTALFDKTWGRGTPIDAKLKWLNDSRLRNDISFKAVVVPFDAEITEKIRALKEQRAPSFFD